MVMPDAVGTLVESARAQGLPPGREGAFLVWLGGEIWGGREVPEWGVLSARAGELVPLFLAEERRRREAAQGPEPAGPAPDGGAP